MKRTAGRIRRWKLRGRHPRRLHRDARAPVPAWRGDLEAFHAACRRRMKWGMQEYGDRSFSKDPRELMREIQQEAMDQHLWSFINWRVIEQMRLAYEEVFGGKLGPRVKEDIAL